MADQTALYDALRKADAAGDTAGAAKLAAYIKGQSATPATVTPKAAPKKPGVDYGLDSLALSKMSFGLSDRALAGADALINGKSYSDAQAELDSKKAAYKASNPVGDWLTLPLNFIGGGAGKALQVGKNVLVQAAKEGAKYGFLSGVGNARGSLPSQALQVAGSTVLGSVAAPIASKVVPAVIAAGDKYAVKPLMKLSQVVSKQPEIAQNVVSEGIQNAPSPTKAARIISNTLATQGTSPRKAGQMIADAKAKGVPLALMDTGDETRGLATGLSMKPGAARTIMRDAVIKRQEGQTERVQGAIERDLGPTTGVATEAQKLEESAKRIAAPLYEKAYEVGRVDDPTINAIATHPEMQAAIKAGREIHANEAFLAKAKGEAPPAPLPTDGTNDVRTLDYAKRALDRKIDAAYSGDSAAKMQIPFLKDLRGTLVKSLDTAVPAYAQARAAYAGPFEMRDALQAGQKAISKKADDIAAETKGMTPAEIDQYKLGIRSALSDAADAKGDYADKVKALVGSPKKRLALAQLFGGEKNFDNFLGTLAHEARTSETYGRVNTGSRTAPNLADMGNAGGLGGVAAKAGGRALSGHGLASNAIQTIADLARYGTGKAAERLRSEVAAGLSETDPVMLADLVRQASRENAGKRLADRKAVKLAPLVAAGAGNASGKTLGTLGGGN